jgi:hypothetical protein
VSAGGILEEGTSTFSRKGFTGIGLDLIGWVFLAEKKEGYSRKRSSTEAES